MHLRNIPMQSTLMNNGRRLEHTAFFKLGRIRSLSSSSVRRHKPFKMAILDDYQGLSKNYLKGIPESDLRVTRFTDTLHPDDSIDALVNRLKPFSIISTMRERTPLPKDVISQLPKLRMLHTTGIRNHVLDLDACKTAEVVVAGTTPAPASSGRTPIGYAATTQHTWALLLGLTNSIAQGNTAITDGLWQHNLPLTVNLTGSTFGCLGLGRLGTAAAKIAATAFGMKVLAWSTSLTQAAADERALSVGLPPGTFQVATSKDMFFKTADVVSIHYVLSPRSVGIVGAQELASMKPTSMLINTSRGPLVDEDALFEALNRRSIRGAALDVFWREPLPDGRWRNTKWGHSNGRSEMLMTPHMGFVSEETMHSWWQQIDENIRRWLSNRELLNRMA